MMLAGSLSHTILAHIMHIWHRVKIITMTMALIVFWSMPLSYADVVDLCDVHIEWSYDHNAVSDQEMLGYKLYKEGEMICVFSGIEIKEGDCLFYSEVGTYDFTLTAYGEQIESVHSATYSHDLIHKGLEIPVLRIRFTLK